MDGRSLVQPFAVAVIPSNFVAPPESTPTHDEVAPSSLASSTEVYSDRQQSVLLLDTGNSRLVISDAETGKVTAPSCLVNEALKGQAATGMSLSCYDGERRGLWIVNWRVNEVMLLDLATNEVRPVFDLCFLKMFFASHLVYAELRHTESQRDTFHTSLCARQNSGSFGLAYACLLLCKYVYLLAVIGYL